jgi:hypothetical protein
MISRTASGPPSGWTAFRSRTTDSNDRFGRLNVTPAPNHMVAGQIDLGHFAERAFGGLTTRSGSAFFHGWSRGAR